VTRWFAVSSGRTPLTTQTECVQRLRRSRHHEHLLFCGWNVWSCELRLLSRGPRVHARVLSFL